MPAWPARRKNNQPSDRQTRPADLQKSVANTLRAAAALPKWGVPIRSNRRTLGVRFTLAQWKSPDARGAYARTVRCPCRGGVSLERDIDPLLDLAVDGWKFARSMQRALARSGAEDYSRAENQIRFFLRRIEAVLASRELKLVSLEGQPFESGMAATPINLDEFAPGDTLVVDQMLEPIAMGPEGVVRTGTLTLRKSP